MTRKFAFVAGACVVFTALIITGMVVKNIHEHFPQAQGPEYWSQAMYWVALDIGFGVLCLTALAAPVISSFARNLSLFFVFQTEFLQRGQGQPQRAGARGHQRRVRFHRQPYQPHDPGPEQRTEELENTRDATIVTLASLAETRDNETGQHILRTQRYVRALAIRLSERPGYADFLQPETIELLYKSAPLHDVGKVGVPDAILLKPGRLTPEEFEQMKMHATYGRDSLKVAENMLGSNSFLRLAQEIAHTHHEKWDGERLSAGPQGKDIPLAG